VGRGPLAGRRGEAGRGGAGDQAPEIAEALVAHPGERVDGSRQVRLDVDGIEHDYVVGARELQPSNLTGSLNNWINVHTVYTHGNGFVAAPANQVLAGQEGGEPNFTTGNLPTAGDIPVKQADIYYGELLNLQGEDDYSIVGAPAGAAPREFDRPEDGNGNGQVNNTYDGKGGVEGAAHRDHARAMGDRLRELAGRDLPRGEDHGARHARACRVRGGRSGRVAGRCAEDHARALFERFRHSDDHSAILE